ncbi:hypothetical protein EYF80_020800 [Liparis tanakae]|uniref:Uncharacterized protein n=1 Tax=Liparis tanakae TaxID=230148 RepID=A0A4Z2HT14_9TELE|nr:hypothetical protein EYF80_020800 [Liparis tanakae]
MATKQARGFATAAMTRVGLHRGQHHVGQRVGPGQDRKDVEHLRPAVRAGTEAAPGLLAGGSVRVHHGLLLRPLPFVLPPVGVPDGALSGHGRVVVQQQERRQAHQHHGAEEEEEHLGREVGRLILSLQFKGHRAVGGVRGAVDAADRSDSLDQSHQGGQQAAQALPDVVGGQVPRLETHHEGQEGDGGRAVDGGEEESQDEQGHAARGARHHRRLPPEESQQEAGGRAQADDGVDDGRFVQGAGPEAVHQGDEERPDVRHLDEDGEVGGQVPTLGDLGDDEGQLHPQAVDGDPGAHPEQTRQQKSQGGSKPLKTPSMQHGKTRAPAGPGEHGERSDEGAGLDGDAAPQQGGVARLVQQSPDHHLQVGVEAGENDPGDDL